MKASNTNKHYGNISHIQHGNCSMTPWQRIEKESLIFIWIRLILYCTVSKVLLWPTSSFVYSDACNFKVKQWGFLPVLLALGWLFDPKAGTGPPNAGPPLVPAPNVGTALVVAPKEFCCRVLWPKTGVEFCWPPNRLALAELFKGAALDPKPEAVPPKEGTADLVGPVPALSNPEKFLEAAARNK